MRLLMLGLAMAAALAGCKRDANGGLAGREQGGPLQEEAWEDGGKTTIAGPVRTGTEMAVGYAVVRNHGSRTAIIEDVRILGATPGIPVKGYYAADGQRDARGSSEDWPLPRRSYPRGSVRRAKGAPVPPLDRSTVAGRMGMELLVRLDLDRPGRYAYDGVRVLYRVGEDRYWVDVPFAFAVCVRSRKVFAGPRCPAPA